MVPAAIGIGEVVIIIIIIVMIAVCLDLFAGVPIAKFIKKFFAKRKQNEEAYKELEKDNNEHNS